MPARWKGVEWAGVKIPTLEQTLATLPEGKLRFFIEIKCGAEIVPALQAVLEPMKERAAQFAIIAFKRDAAAASKKAMPWLKVYRLASGMTRDKKPRTDLQQLIAQTKADKLDGLNLGADWPRDEAMVKKIRRARLGLYVWTVNKPEEARRFAGLGVDGISTDNPVLMRETLTRN